MIDPARQTSSPSAALAALGSAYQTWACSARYHREAIDRSTRWSLRLAVGGAIAAAIGEQIAPLARSLPRLPWLQWLPWLQRALGVAGAGAIALAAYLSRQAQTEDQEGLWTRCRAAAETLKSALFVCRAAVAPFAGPERAARIREQIDRVGHEMAGIEPRQPAGPAGPAGDDAVPRLDLLDVNGYRTERVADQVAWYRQRALAHQRSADRCRSWTGWLMGISALLAVASADDLLSAWAPVVAAVTVSLTAHLKGQRYQSLIAIYTATALRLQSLDGEWLDSGKTDHDTVERDAFIRRCEETLATENGAWFALRSKKRDSDLPAPAAPASV